MINSKDWAKQLNKLCLAISLSIIDTAQYVRFKHGRFKDGSTGSKDRMIHV